MQGETSQTARGEGQDEDEEEDAKESRSLNSSAVPDDAAGEMPCKAGAIHGFVACPIKAGARQDGSRAVASRIAPCRKLS